MIKIINGTPASGMTYQSVRLLPFRPSCPKCPTCKAFMGVNPVGEWSRCSSCGTSFHDLDGRHAIASALASKYVSPVAPVVVSPDVLLMPDGRYRKVKPRVKAVAPVDQLSLFGGVQ